MQVASWLTWQVQYIVLYLCSPWLCDILPCLLKFSSQKCSLTTVSVIHNAQQKFTFSSDFNLRKQMKKCNGTKVHYLNITGVTLKSPNSRKGWHLQTDESLFSFHLVSLEFEAVVMFYCVLLRFQTHLPTLKAWPFRLASQCSFGQYKFNRHTFPLSHCSLNCFCLPLAL